jgi:hypothetical protein
MAITTDRHDRSEVVRNRTTDRRSCKLPVAASLVASICLHFLDVLSNLKRRRPKVIACDAEAKNRMIQHGPMVGVFAPDSE